MNRFSRYMTVTAITLLVIPIMAYSQIYRPPLKWYHLRTPHFHVIYNQGEETTARATASILEDQYQNVDSLTGGSLHNFPVILNGYDDLSNGFVTPLLFRMEVETPAMKGKTLNPRTGGWLENVFPHELVHAMQFSVLPWVGVSGLVRLFSPDVARSLQANIVAGFDEGLAVYNESNVRPGIGGRGNYAMFTNYFHANLYGNHTWGMGQILGISGQTRPFDRHYIGGYQYVQWLESKYGKKKVRNIINFDSRLPFLGLGVAVWANTKTWPGRLYHEFLRDKRNEERLRLDSLNSVAIQQNKPISLPYTGPEIRRPLWLNDHTLIFHASFYNEKPGFYTYDLSRDKLHRIITSGSVGDYRYDLNSKRDRLIFANYRPSPFYTNDFKTDVYELDIPSGSVKRLTNKRRVFAPVFKGSAVWALQTDQQSARWVYINGQGQIHSLLDIKPNTIVAISPNPTDSSITAVVANRNGVQGIWFIRGSNRQHIDQDPPDIAFHNASIFDPSWSPDGTKILFSCDRGGTMNVYSYNLKSKKIWQLTNSKFNAFEASYSPNSKKIAYIRQVGSNRVPVVIDVNNTSSNRIAVINRGSNLAIKRRINDKRLADQWNNGGTKIKTGRYHTGLSWLKPRAIVPYFSNHSLLGYRWGAYVASSDVLQRNYYLAEFSYSNTVLWYDINYRFTGFYPGFSLRAYRKPTPDVYLYQNQSDPTNSFYYTIETQGYSASIPIPIVLEQNVRYSSLYFEPKVEYERLRPITRTFYFKSWDDAATGDLYGALNLHLQKNIRDAQPNSGSVLFSEAKFDIITSLPQKRYAFRAGIYRYISPLSRLNQSLRLGFIYQTQTKFGLFSNSDLVSDGFIGYPLLGVNNAFSFQTRYTIPIFTPDNGGFLIPLYVQQVYGTLFSDTITNLNSSNILKSSRSIYGVGLHFVTGLSNVRIDIGVGLAYEATRNKFKGFWGTN